MFISRAATLCAATLLSAGCATSALHTESSTAAIRAAEEVGAKDVPSASLHLQYAKESLDRATQLQKEGDKEEAASMLTRAQVDAELAIVLSRQEGEKQQAREAIDRVRQLRQDNPDRN